MKSTSFIIGCSGYTVSGNIIKVDYGSNQISEGKITKLDATSMEIVYTDEVEGGVEDYISRYKRQ